MSYKKISNTLATHKNANDREQTFQLCKTIPFFQIYACIYLQYNWHIVLF